MADFIGEANLIDCVIEQVQGETATVRIGELQIELPAREQLTGEAVMKAPLRS